jgi:uncharacterized transporter YbjL
MQEERELMALALVGGVLLALALLCFATSVLVQRIGQLVHPSPPPQAAGVLPAASASSPGTSAAEDAREAILVCVK